MSFISRHLKDLSSNIIRLEHGVIATAKSQTMRRGIPCSHHTACLLMIHQNLVTAPFLALGGSHGRRWLSSSPKSQTKRQKWKDVDSSPRKINERGGVFIYIGWTILGLVGVDQALQHKQEQEDKERRQLLAQMQIDADNASFNVADWDKTLPTIFTCKIVHIDPGLDGTKMLTRSKKDQNSTLGGINKNIRRGDVVEIIETNVGPDKRYHLCRMRGEKSDSNDSSDIVVGWYPIEYLERIDY